MEASIPPLELELEDVILLFIFAELKAGVFPQRFEDDALATGVLTLLLTRAPVLTLPWDILVLDELLEDIVLGIITDDLDLFMEASVTAEYPFLEEMLLPILQLLDASAFFCPKLLLWFSKLTKPSDFKISILLSVVEIFSVSLHDNERSFFALSSHR